MTERIASWFKNQHPKQNRTLEIYAIEADKDLHEEQGRKKEREAETRLASRQGLKLKRKLI